MLLIQQVLAQVFDFDSSALSLNSVSDVFAGAIATGTLNEDGNGLNFGWADIFGGTWPGSTNADLAVVVLDVLDGSSTPSITITPTSNAAFCFQRLCAYA